MSIIALFMALLLLSMHACNARLTFGFISYNKDAEKSKQHGLDTKDFPMFEDTKETLLEGKIISIATLDESQRAIEMQGLKKERRMLESGSDHETKEPAGVDDSNEDEAVEDVVVMDYVQPHRKSPIHNRRH